MANLEQIVSQKAENDTRWKAQQQSERENTVALQDAGIMQITSSPEAYARYLDMQGDNPAYSVGNIALVMVALPQATVFGTRDRWRALNRSVMGEEMNNGVKIFARGPMGRGYVLADAYDVSQTQGRDLKRPVLKEGSKGMETALTTVLNYAVAPVVIDKELPVPAYYDPGSIELAINPISPTMRRSPLLPQRWHSPASTPRAQPLATTGPSASWTPRACLTSSAAGSGSSGLCRRRNACRSCMTAGKPRTAGTHWTPFRT